MHSSLATLGAYSFALLDLDPGQGLLVNHVRHGRYGTTGSLMLSSEPGSNRPYNKLPALTKQKSGSTRQDETRKLGRVLVYCTAFGISEE